jgi:predicted phosphatase
MIKLMGIVTGKPKVKEAVDLKPAVDKIVGNLVDKIVKLTDRNDHTGSIIELATFLNDTKAIKLLQSIQTIHKIEGSIPSEISKYRDNILKGLMVNVKSKLGSDVAKAINGAF